MNHIVDRTICRALCGEIISYRAGPAQGDWWIAHTGLPTCGSAEGAPWQDPPRDLVDVCPECERLYLDGHSRAGERDSAASELRARQRSALRALDWTERYTATFVAESGVLLGSAALVPQGGSVTVPEARAFCTTRGCYAELVGSDDVVRRGWVGPDGSYTLT